MEVEVSKKSTIIALLWIVAIGLIYGFSKYVNFRIYEPASYFFIIILIGYVFRGVIKAMVDSPKKIFSDETVMSFFDLSGFPKLFEGSVRGLLTKKIKVRQTIVFLVFQTLVVFLIIYIYKQQYRSSFSVLLTYLYFNYAYFLYLSIRQKVVKKNNVILGLFGLAGLGLLVLFFKLESWSYALNIILTFFSAWILILGMSVKKEYIYALGLIMIIMLPFLIFFGLSSYAEFIGICVFLTLSMGLINEFFGEWIFEKT